MSFIGDIFSGDKGAGYQGKPADLAGNFGEGGADESYNNSLAALHQQQSLVNALNAQNGLGNQANVFNQLQNQANGVGPNPAQAMLNQSTGQNIAQQAALMGSQRGVGANPGLLARQAAQQGAGIQQNAAGQAATLAANQRLNALNQLGGLANQQVANQIGGVQGLNAASQGQEGIYNAGIAAQNNANVGMQSNINNVNGQIANTNAQGQQAITGGLIKSLSSVPAMARGGMIPHFDDGGPVGAPSLGVDTQLPVPSFNQYVDAMGGPAPQAAPAASAAAPTPGASSNPGAQALYDAFNFSNRMGGGGGGSGGGSGGGGGLGSLAMLALAEGGNVGPKSKAAKHIHKSKSVPAMVSPGEIYLSPDKAKKVAEGKASPLSGERIPGKAKVSGNSYANDTVPKTLQEGGVVIPRDKALGKDVHQKAADFVAAVMAHQGMKKGR